MALAIETHGLTKRYGRHRGIEGIDLAVEQGEIFGFIGPNGAGKSTTIRTMLGLVRKTSGEVRLLGMDADRERVEILRRTGYLPGEVAYYDRMRAHDLLRYSAGFYDDPRACLDRAEDLAARLNLDLRRRVDDMSLGNRKKLGIAQALMHAPDLIVLDEPTSGLDPLVQKTFLDLIREENARGATVLFSSHVLSEVQRICDRVAIIRDGRIVDARRMDELRGGAAHRVAIELAAGASLPEDGIPVDGVHSLKVDAVSVEFIFDGDLPALLGFLSGLPLVDLQITEPDLEEVFMHYYALDRLSSPEER